MYEQTYFFTVSPSLLYSRTMLYDLPWLIYGPCSNENSFGYVELMSHILTVSMYHNRREVRSSIFYSIFRC